MNIVTLIIEQTNCILLHVITYFTIVKEKDSYRAEFQKKDEPLLKQSNEQSKCTYVCMHMY